MMTNLSIKNRYLLLITVTILLIVLSYAYIYKPTWQKYHSLKENQEEQETRLEEIQKITETLESFKDKEASYQSKLKEQSVYLPNKVNSAELLFLLKQKADEVKVELVKIEAQPSRSTKASKLQINPYLVAVKGNPELIKKYIENIQDLRRKIVITSFNIKKENVDAAGKLSTKYIGTINIQAYNLRDRALVEYDAKLVIP